MSNTNEEKDGIGDDNYLERIAPENGEKKTRTMKRLFLKPILLFFVSRCDFVENRIATELPDV